MRRNDRKLGPAISTAFLLGSISPTVHAQYVPPLLVAAVLSPLLVLVLCGVLAALSRSLRNLLIHAGGIVTWVVLVALFSYTIENDYVIWTPLVLYGLHSVAIVGLILVEIAKRVLAHSRPDPRPSQAEPER